jgi:membrane associated rhomboid family serine protease
MKKSNDNFGSWQEAFTLSALLLLLMWLFYWAQHLFSFDFYQLGLRPQTLSGLWGILFMPLIHSKEGFEHILNNSIPTFFMFSAIIYYYRAIAFQFFIYSWLGTGIILWLFVPNVNTVHIGMSGMVYAMSSFLFTSGVLRKYLPLQAISLFLVFVYGSMVWGIFPTQERISWEGHLIGFSIGIFLALVYKKQGPQRHKFNYEIEKELGIEPPDLEGIWHENLANQQRELDEIERMKTEQKNTFKIIYHYTKPNQDPPQDEIEFLK